MDGFCWTQFKRKLIKSMGDPGKSISLEKAIKKVHEVNENQ